MLKKSKLQMCLLAATLSSSTAAMALTGDLTDGLLDTNGAGALVNATTGLVFDTQTNAVDYANDVTNVTVNGAANLVSETAAGAMNVAAVAVDTVSGGALGGDVLAPVTGVVAGLTGGDLLGGDVLAPVTGVVDGLTGGDVLAPVTGVVAGLTGGDLLGGDVLAPVTGVVDGLTGSVRNVVRVTLSARQSLGGLAER